MTSTSLLPSYQRFVNGVPVPLFSRRAFRPREKYLILLVFLTFGVVCFGAFFFLPDFRSGTGGAAVNSVYRVYQRIQKAGPELLIPAPPHAILGPMDPHGPGAAHPNGLSSGLGHHEDEQDIHLIADKQKLQAKINEEYQQQKTLEKPEVADSESRVRTSSAFSMNVGGRRGHEEFLETVPPAPAEVLPRTEGGEDKDPTARERRDKVKEIQILTSCYANQTKTIAVVGDYTSRFIERLSVYELFALVSLHSRIRSEYKITDLYQVDRQRKHKVDILVAMAFHVGRFSMSLWDFRHSLYDNPMALTLLLVWSPQEKDAGCDAETETAAFFRVSNPYNHLNTILICHHKTTGIMMYSSNPFENQAPQPWRLVPYQEIVHRKWSFFFVRKHRVNEEMCKNLTFDKTRKLNGSLINIDPIDEVLRQGNELEVKGSRIRHHRLEQQRNFGLIDSFISYVNASAKIGISETIEVDRYEVAVSDIRMLNTQARSYSYPNTRKSTFLVTQFRGNKSQLGKILGVIDDYSRFGMIIVYSITLLFFRYFLRQPVLAGILNLCRLTCNCGLLTLPRNSSSRIYLVCLLFFVVTMQGIFTGNLAALLTHDFPVRQVNSIQDVIELNYTVYAEYMDAVLFADPRFENRVITLNFIGDCIEKVKLDATIVCVVHGAYFKAVALESNLYVSSEDIDEVWTCNKVPWRWSLLERFNKFQGILIAASAVAPFQTMVEEKRLLEAEAIDIPSKPKVMTWEDLRFAFIILGIGLVCASITFMGEITIHWY